MHFIDKFFWNLKWMIKDFFAPPNTRQLIERKIKKSLELFLPTPAIRKIEKRRYLTLDGIKNWNELTEEDKYSLNLID